jgi:Protein of unknown function (DUF4232)
MKTRILVVVGAAALVAAAGCGGDGTTIGSAAPTSTATTSDPGSTPPQPTESEPGSSGAAPTSAAPETTTSGAGATSTRCHTSELAASFGSGDAGAGNRYATLTLTNRSARTCTIYGYGGLQPLDSAKKQLSVTLVRDPGHAPKLVRLAPGAGVGRTIHWGVVPSGTQTSCPTPAYASIIPPDETDPLVVAWKLGPICGGRIDGVPYGTTL